MYIGRFAPSPTGPLHFGSLIAAVGSYLEARAQQGRWLVRIDDLDPPREQPGAAADILHTLEHFGFEWDGPVVYQSRRHSAYREALARLTAGGLTYPCSCSRKEIAETGRSGASGPIYTGACRNPANRRNNKPLSIRVRVPDRRICLHDGIQGEYCQNLAIDIGDFTLLRRDGLYSYHLAVTVDDAWQNITHIVRGIDLLDSAPRQLYLQELLGLPAPAYAHLPVAVNHSGQKLSKQSHAASLSRRHANRQLWQALCFLGQLPPSELEDASMADLWMWAQNHWSMNKVPQVDAIQIQETPLDDSG
jgi:glutamyl-Q tRNA(Asp) synthetase